MVSLPLPARPRPWRTPRSGARHTGRLSLRWRLTLLYGLTFAATLAALLLTVNHFLVGVLLSDTDEWLSEHTIQLSATLAEPEALNTPQRVNEALRSAESTVSVRPSLMIVRNAHGEIVGATLENQLLFYVRGVTSTGVGAASVRLETVRPTASEMARLARGETTLRTIESAGRDTRVASTAIRSQQGEVLGVVQAGESLEGVLTASDRLQALLIGEGAVGLAVALLFGYVFVRRGLRPLDEVGAVAADIEAHDLTRRIDMKGQPAEVQRLAGTFDAMLERIERSFDQQRRFVLDVSHELRTPLTSLRGNLDVLLMDPRLDEPLRSQLERMSAETGRLIRLSANLLTLGHADAGKPLVLAPVELDLLCLEVLQQTHTLKPGVRLRLGHEDQAEVMGDRDLLKQLLLNLIENGLRYTPEGGSVTVSLYRDAHQAVIEVADTGVGIAPDDLPHIYERFYRATDARRHAAGGAGLGLSLVQWIAGAHHGSVDVESQQGEGSTFRVRLPLAEP